ncbi:Cof-type HAD-IIB family hydrolase [Clostridium sp. SHJSY1]|uniref:HAD family hydrolase n=1 Tax=Clostridium sp. SHJSY1 TaxID=2942483 RepID=UPI0028756417|nr:HAD family hydrolase [Clostridium sp. SHJSY1]MDS0524601.1 Cof-type HAD-IIB family hydrolase [Clostridium sp. SHJSY1]
MKPKIIFFDIDGTILTEKTLVIPESTKRAIRKAQENGHLAFINTGRPIVSIDTFIKDIKFDGYICGCGTYIEYADKVLFSKQLGNKLSKDVVNDLKECKIDAILEGENGLYYDEDSNINSKELMRIKKRHIEEHLYNGETWNSPEINFDKLTIWTRDDSNFEEFNKKYSDVFEFIHRGKDFYELVPLGFSKSSGIEYIIKYLNLPFENTYAIGDSTNDLSMLKYVKNSIAMGNSNPILFDFVSFVTKDIGDDGIEYALKHFNII